MAAEHPGRVARRPLRRRHDVEPRHQLAADVRRRHRRVPERRQQRELELRRQHLDPARPDRLAESGGRHRAGPRPGARRVRVLRRPQHQLLRRAVDRPDVGIQRHHVDADHHRQHARWPRPLRHVLRLGAQPHRALRRPAQQLLPDRRERHVGVRRQRLDAGHHAEQPRPARAAGDVLPPGTQPHRDVRRHRSAGRRRRHDVVVRRHQLDRRGGHRSAAGRAHRRQDGLRLRPRCLCADRRRRPGQRQPDRRQLGIRRQRLDADRQHDHRPARRHAGL